MVTSALYIPTVARLLTDGTSLSRWCASCFPPLSRPPILRDHGLQMHLQSCSIMVTKCISKLARTLLPSASPNSLYWAVQLHLWAHSVIVSKCISKLNKSRPPFSHHDCVQVHLHTRSIVVSKWISELTRSHPQKCISKLVRSPPSHASLSSTKNSLQVYLWVHSIFIIRRTSNCSQALPPTCPDVPSVDG
jgi:hypothetical protein